MNAQTAMATATPGPVLLTVQPEAARFNLRIDPGHLAAASDAFGLSLPSVIGQGVEDGARRALCLGPDEWMLSAAGPDRDKIIAAFARLYAELPHSLVEISDREIAVTLECAHAATLLSVGCPVDVESFAVGTGARTIFDGVQVVLYREGPDRFTMEIWRSFLPHVLDLLETGKRELAAGL
jgi:sarcosine oxidase, subunit gamma